MSDTNNTSAVKLLSHPTAAKVPTERYASSNAAIIHSGHPHGRSRSSKTRPCMQRVQYSGQRYSLQSWRRGSIQGILVRGRMRNIGDSRSHDVRAVVPPLDCLGLRTYAAGNIYYYSRSGIVCGVCARHRRTKELMESPAVTTVMQYLNSIRTKLEKFSGLSRYETRRW